MNEASSTSSPATSQETDSGTSSQESRPGPTRSASQGGQMTFPFGPGHALASHSAAPASAAGSTTSGISGPRGYTSSERAGRLLSLANRLRQEEGLPGSTSSPIAWSERATPSGRWISVLRSSARFFFVAHANPDGKRHVRFDAEVARIQTAAHLVEREIMRLHDMVQAGDGVAAGVGQRGPYGNAINAQVAAAFIRAVRSPYD
jgi:hypothetical protein